MFFFMYFVRTEFDNGTFWICSPTQYFYAPVKICVFIFKLYKPRTAYTIFINLLILFSLQLQFPLHSSFFFANSFSSFSGWYEDNWYEVNLENENISCTKEQMKMAAEGHLTTEALMWNQNSEKTISGMSSEDFRWVLLFSFCLFMFVFFIPFLVTKHNTKCFIKCTRRKTVGKCSIE